MSTRRRTSRPVTFAAERRVEGRAKRPWREALKGGSGAATSWTWKRTDFVGEDGTRYAVAAGDWEKIQGAAAAALTWLNVRLAKGRLAPRQGPLLLTLTG